MALLQDKNCDLRHPMELCHPVVSTPLLCSIRMLLQCVAVCCSVLHCVAVCCSVLQCVFRVYPLLCSIRMLLQCVAVCCSMLQCVFRVYPLLCSIRMLLQCVAAFVCCCSRSRQHDIARRSCSVLSCVAVCCSMLQCVAVCCSVLLTI